jgi:TolB-like protein/predicted Ser/Thr protein kinase
MHRTVGPYEITGTLGEGGMGIVYAARDGRLDRTVALKMIRRALADPSAAERLRREARTAATVNHPNICQLYDIGEQDGELYIAMEYLDGEPLAARLARGPLPLAEAVAIELAVLSALQALHNSGVMHRDLKPSNIYLTTHGVKLLDFGLARTIGMDEAETRLTMPGTLLGTPRYLAPELIGGLPVDARGDIFAAGAVLYEMLTGDAPFTGRSLAEVVHAIVYDQPPALGGSPAVAAVDRVIHKAIAKRPHERYASAEAMADELRAAMRLDDRGAAAPAVRPMTRLEVLPFRLLRPDAEVDFLAFGLSDALTTSLSGLSSLVVRSSLAAAGLTGDTVDLAQIAEKADVDAVLTGTLLRAGDQLRVTTQLVEVPGGTVRWSQQTQVRLGDIFQLQDALTSRIVDSLAVPLSAREERIPKRDVPATAKAYEFYLRANQIAYQSKTWTVARDLYRQCLEEDPGYAPAWARLARMYRVIAMYTGEDSDATYALADEAFKRALELNPDLSLAHNLFTVVELETGRAREAMLRLLQRARVQLADPELFAGLVQACRYGGLEAPAIAAHEQARRLDPHIKTAVGHACLMAGDYERAIATDEEEPPFVTALALDLMGRKGEAIDLLRAQLAAGVPQLLRFYLETTLGVLEEDRAAATVAADGILKRWRLRDPCARYYLARSLAIIGHPQALPVFKETVDAGFHPYAFYSTDPWLNPLRSNPGFQDVLKIAEDGHRSAAKAFAAAGGEMVLGKLDDAYNSPRPAPNSQLRNSQRPTPNSQVS